MQILNNLTNGWRLLEFSHIICVVTLCQLDEEILSMISGKTKGRCVVDQEGVA